MYNITQAQVLILEGGNSRKMVFTWVSALWDTFWVLGWKKRLLSSSSSRQAQPTAGTLGDPPSCLPSCSLLGFTKKFSFHQVLEPGQDAIFAGVGWLWGQKIENICLSFSKKSVIFLPGAWFTCSPVPTDAYLQSTSWSGYWILKLVFAGFLTEKQVAPLGPMGSSLVQYLYSRVWLKPSP